MNRPTKRSGARRRALLGTTALNASMTLFPLGLEAEERMQAGRVPRGPLLIAAGGKTWRIRLSRG